METTSHSKPKFESAKGTNTQPDSMDIDDPAKLNRIKAAEMETEVHLYDGKDKRIAKNFTEERRMSQNNMLAAMLNENYIGDEKVNNFENTDYTKRETRALSQEIEDMKEDKLSNEAMDADEDMDDIDDSEGENEIVLIEEEYKSVLEDQEDNKDSVSRNDFDFVKLIGSGAHAKVYLARKKDTKMLYAIKVLEKRELNKKKQHKGTKVERRILEDIDSPFLVKMHYAFQSRTRLFMVLEYCFGGELFFYLKHMRKFMERTAKFYAANIVLGLRALHEHKVVYRDLKPENVLVCQDGYLKITDFGLAKQDVDINMGANTLCGTPEYLAPEVIKGRPYGRAADWWSFGSIVYEMLVGIPPFYSTNRDQMFKNIINHETDYPSTLSEDAIDLISKLLEKDPEDRMGSSESDAEEVMKHKWFELIDWDALYKKELTPPYKPDPSEDGLNYFDEEFTKEDIKVHVNNFSPVTSNKSMSDNYSDFEFQKSESNDDN